MTRTSEGRERKRVKKRREIKWKTDKLISEEKNKGRRRGPTVKLEGVNHLTVIRKAILRTNCTPPNTG